MSLASVFIDDWERCQNGVMSTWSTYMRQNQQNDLCAQQRLRSAWASAQSDQSLRCPHEKTLATHWAHCKDSDQTGRMPRLIWVFAGHTDHFVGFVMFVHLICSKQLLNLRWNHLITHYKHCVTILSETIFNVHTWNLTKLKDKILWTLLQFKCPGKHDQWSHFTDKMQVTTVLFLYFWWQNM